MARICAALMSKTDKQFIYINNTTGSGLSEAAKHAFEEIGIPVLFGMRESLGAIAHWSRWSTPVVSERVRPPKLEWGPRTVAAQNESERLALLREAGIPMVETHVVDSADAAWTTANLLGKTVMKGTALTLLHKSEHGLVMLSLHGEVAVRTAYQQLAEALEVAAPAVTGKEILLQTMMDEGVELILDAHHHEGFGTVIAVGLGGTLVEVIKQASVRLAPIDVEATREMLEETPAATLLSGTRGKGPFDFDAACEVIVAFAQFAAATEGHLRAIEINPLLVLSEGCGVCGLDAVFER
jgi:acyl-CoA synthetase (NDP forming)